MTGERIPLLYAVTHPMTARLLLRGQLSWLAERGFDVTVLTSTEDEPAADDGARHTVRRIPMAREIAPLADLVSLVRLVRELRRLRPRLVNASTPKAGLLGTLAARLAGVPVRIYTLRGLRLETASGWRRRLLLATERLACRSAHRVLCVSESLRRRCLELGIGSPDKLRVAAGGSSNGIDVARFAQAEPSTVERLRGELRLGDAPVVGFVGRLTRDKGVEDLVELLERIEIELPEVRLLLVGGHEPGDPVPEATRLRLDAHPRVHDVGPVDDPAPYYALMHLLAFPSRREGLPNAPLEAAAAGIPTVGYRVTGTVDAIEDGATGALVQCGDVEALSATALGYLCDDERRRRHGRTARERAARDFDRQRVWRAIEGEYRELLEAAGQTVRGEAGRTGGADAGSGELAGLGGCASRRPDRRRASPYRRAGKRALDLALGSIALGAALPVMLAVALLVRLRLGSPVLYRQRRPGRDGRLFTLLKFRTMSDARDERGALLPDADRLTPLGRALRRWSLDELPELWNVVRGDMSLVGPRPLLTAYLERYDPEQARRHEVPPGITGWAQVNGRNALSWARRFELDVWYVDHQSLALDLRILMDTCRKVVTGEGITAAGHATMPEFRGTPGGRT